MDRKYKRQAWSQRHSGREVSKTGNEERGTRNEERVTRNGERGTGNGKRETGNGKRETGNGKRETENGERGTGKWKLGTKPYLNPSPISNFISNSLPCSHFFLSCFPCSFPGPFSPFKQHPSGSVHEISFNTWRQKRLLTKQCVYQLCLPACADSNSS